MTDTQAKALRAIVRDKSAAVQLRAPTRDWLLRHGYIAGCQIGNVYSFYATTKGVAWAAGYDAIVRGRS